MKYLNSSHPKTRISSFFYVDLKDPHPIHLMRFPSLQHLPQKYVQILYDICGWFFQYGIPCNEKNRGVDFFLENMNIS